MILTITREERELLTILGREAEQRKLAFESAARDFRIAFEMGMRARNLTDMLFVQMDDEGLHVESATGPKLVVDDPDEAA